MIVLDASVAVAAVREAEPSHAASRVRVEALLSGDDTIVVPAIFSIEVASALARVGEPGPAVRAYVDALLGAAVEVVTIGRRSARPVRELAVGCRLRAADAVYVWVASRRELPLVTLDREVLARAASVCEVVEP